MLMKIMAPLRLRNSSLTIRHIGRQGFVLSALGEEKDYIVFYGV